MVAAEVLPTRAMLHGHLLGRDAERFAHRVVDALVGLVRDEQVDVVELARRRVAAALHRLRQLGHRVLEDVPPLHARDVELCRRRCFCEMKGRA